MNSPKDRNGHVDKLNFPNPSRSYNPTGRGVRFWGYDQAIEVSFFIEDLALLKLSPETNADEQGLVSAFDANRDRICAVANKAYFKRCKPSHIVYCTLTDADF